MRKVLGPKFFERSALKVAPELLGKFLVKRGRGKEIAMMITEVEAYLGLEDKASHASKGKTKRNEIMFGPGGHWYLYLIYGVYWMLNIVTGKTENPSGILIRGLENIEGPGRLTKQLKINKSFNHKPANKNTDLWIEDRGVQIKKAEIKKGPRIGIDYAGPVWSKKHYRFYLKKQS